jgi:hypothetical protein
MLPPSKYAYKVSRLHVMRRLVIDSSAETPDSRRAYGQICGLTRVNSAKQALKYWWSVL